MMRPLLLRTATVALLLVAPAACGVRTRERASQLGAQSLASEFRVTEGRLSGFPYAPIQRGAILPPKLLSVAAKALRLNGSRVERLHNAGVLSLLRGHARVAQSQLLDAICVDAGEVDPRDALLRSRNAALLSDLAAAVVESVRTSMRDEDLLIALTAATRSAQLDGNVEALWNRAIVLELLPMRGAAIRSWREYVAHDDASPWATEASTRARALALATDDHLWRRVTTAFEQGHGGDSLGRFPARAYAYGERHLGLWGHAVLRGDNVAADRAFSRTRVVATSLRRSAGDLLLEDTIAAIERLSDRREAAQACAAYDNARHEPTFGQAVKSLAYAEAALHAAGLPLAIRARVARAAAQYESRHHQDALNTLGGSRSFATDRYPLAAGHWWWTKGLALASLGFADRAADAYHSALAVYARAGDRASAGFIELLLADNSEYVGDTGSAWHWYRLALADMSVHVDRRRAVLLITTMARSAARAGYPLAALQMYGEAVSGINSSDDPASLCHVLVSRAATERHLRMDAAAASDAKQAKMLFERIGDPAVRAQLFADVAIASAVTQQHRDPHVYDAAIAFTKSIADHFRLARLHLDRGLELADAGCLSAAEEDFAAGIGELESQRLKLESDESRIGYLDTTRDLFDNLIRLHIRRRRFVEAWTVAEMRSARVLQERIANVEAGASELGRSLGPTTALIRYLPDGARIHAWILTNHSLHYRSLRLSDLPRRIDSYRDELQNDRTRHWLKSATDLHHALVTPLLPLLSGVDRLVIVPDDDLARLPFETLTDASTHQPLIARYAVSVVPSVRVALATVKRRTPPKTVLLVSVPSPNIAGMTLPLLRTNVRRFVANAAKRFATVTVLSSRQATVTTVSQALRRADLVHFDGHAVMRGRDEMALALMRDGGDSDGFLAASAIERGEVNPGACVVLAACSTGLGRSSSDGMRSLARAFLVAGASTVIASHWDVDDDATSAFFARFYRRLAEGGDVARALRLTQLDFLADPQLAAPRYWAAFHQIGGAS